MKCHLLAIAALAPVFAQQPEGRYERTLNVSGPVELDLSTDSGGIVVIPGNAGVVRVRGILKAYPFIGFLGDAAERIRKIEANPPIEQTGNRIRVGHVSDRKILRGIAMRLEIEAPVDTRLRAVADSGGVRVEGLKGPVDCRTDSGGIRISRIGSEVRASADSGGIHIRDVEGPVYARADSGGIEATGVGGPIDVQTDSGGIQLQQTKAATVRAHADSGGANLRLVPGVGYDLAVRSSSGRVSTPVLDSGASVSRHEARGKLRGGGPRVDIALDSGTVIVD